MIVCECRRLEYSFEWDIKDGKVSSLLKDKAFRMYALTLIHLWGFSRSISCQCNVTLTHKIVNEEMFLAKEKRVGFNFVMRAGTQFCVNARHLKHARIKVRRMTRTPSRPNHTRYPRRSDNIFTDVIDTASGVALNVIIPS